jgi:hypothetical protein
MIFYIHGWHKLEGWIAYLQHGTPWKLAKEVREMSGPGKVSAFCGSLDACNLQALVRIRYSLAN